MKNRTRLYAIYVVYEFYTNEPLVVQKAERQQIRPQHLSLVVKDVKLQELYVPRSGRSVYKCDENLT